MFNKLVILAVVLEMTAVILGLFVLTHNLVFSCVVGSIISLGCVGLAWGREPVDRG